MDAPSAKQKHCLWRQTVNLLFLRLRDKDVGETVSSELMTKGSERIMVVTNQSMVYIETGV